MSASSSASLQMEFGGDELREQEIFQQIKDHLEGHGMTLQRGIQAAGFR